MFSPAYGDNTDNHTRLELLNQSLPPIITSSRKINAGKLVVEYQFPGKVPPLGRMHKWLLKITESGKPVKKAQLKFRGGMPQHAHGLASQPSVQEIGDGAYNIQGVKFEMPGWWHIEIEVIIGGKTSIAKLDLNLNQNISDSRLAETEQLKQLWLGSLPPLKYAFDPEAVKLGKELFFDVSLSKNNKTSCATCHQPEYAMGPASPKPIFISGQGLRKVPSLIGVGWQNWFNWDGRKDSLWSQALGSISDPNHLGMNAEDYVRQAEIKYKQKIEKIFGSVKNDQDRFANLGKAIAAYEISLAHQPSAFDAYVERTLKLVSEHSPRKTPFSENEFGECEQLGLKIFLGKGRCINCHNGPRFENNSFHNTGLPVAANEVSRGRFSGIKLAKLDPFRCKNLADCPEMAAAPDGETRLTFAYKTPSLRNVARQKSFMHDGSLSSLAEVVEHYRNAPPNYNGTELLPLDVSQKEADSLVCFLKSLNE